MRFVFIMFLVINSAYAQNRAELERLCNIAKDNLQRGNDFEDMAKDMGASFEQLPTSIKSKFKQAYVEITPLVQGHAGTVSPESTCLSVFEGNNQLVKLATMQDLYFGLKTPPAVVIPEIPVNVAEAHCDEEKAKQDAQICDVYGPIEEPVITPLVYDMNKVQNWTKPPKERFSENNCACLKKKTPASSIKQEELSESKKKLNQVVLKASAEKLLNDYSSNYEDVGFYFNTKSKVLKDEKNTERFELFCNNGRRLNELMDEACKTSGVDPKSRLELFFGFGGVEVKKNNGLSASLIALGKEISEYKEDPKKLIPGQSKILTRQSYDKLRASFALEQPDVEYINEMTSAISQSKKLQDKLFDKIGDGIPPYVAFQAIMSDSMHSREMEKIKKTVDKKIKQKFPATEAAFYTRLQQPDGISQSFTLAMQVHPGLKRLMSNNHFFFDVQEALEKSNNKDEEVSMLQFIEQDKKVLSESFVKDCEKFQRNFALTMCMKEDDIIPNTNRIELDKVLKTEKEDLGDQKLIDYAVCTAKPAMKDSPFESLTLANEQRISDFYRVRKNPASPQSGISNSFKTISDPSNRDLQGQVAAMTNKYESQFDATPFSFEADPKGNRLIRASGGSISSGDALDLARASGSPTSSSPISHQEIPVSTSSGSTKENVDRVAEVQVPNQVLNQPPVNTQPAFIPESRTFAGPNREIASEDEPIPEKKSSSDQVLSPAKKELQDILGSRAENKSVKENMSFISDKDAKELVRLREEMAADKKLINDLQLAAEKKETERLKKEYQDLDQKYQSLLKNQGQPAQQFQGTTGGFSGGSINSTPGTEASAPEEVNPQQMAGANFNPSSSGQKIAPSNLPSQVKVDKGTITVDLKQSKESDREEEIFKIVESTEDGKVLEQIQKSGMVYVYKVVEGDQVKDVVETVPFERLNPKLQELVKSKLEKIKQISTVEGQLVEARRRFAAQALRLELLLLDHQAKRRTN